MASAGGENAALPSDRVALRPTVATVWDGAAHKGIEPESSRGLSELRDATDRDDTVWVGCLLTSLDEDGEAWFTGSFDIWDSMENPVVSWEGMSTVLEAVGLATPAPEPEREAPQSTLLRAMPYVYTRGVFGTIRDVLPSEEMVDKLTPFVHGGRLTGFPAVGFHPVSSDKRLTVNEYVMLRSVVGVVNNVVLTVRLPDRICAPDAGRSRRSNGDPIKLVLPRRFLPLRTMPGGRELAEAIGIHQATTARGVAEQVRARLAKGTGEGENLRRGRSGAEQGTDLRQFASAAAEEADRLSEVAQQLDQQIAQVLRRMGTHDGDAPKGAERLAPAEVERRYSFALQEVRALYEDCRLTSHVVRQAISDHDQQQSQRFQFVAAVLASIVLIPTLLASIFGANVSIPAEKSAFGFRALVAVILMLVVVSLYTLRTAQKYHWKPPSTKLILPTSATVLIIGAYVVFLARS
jgi:hypothetical protein